MGTKHVALNTYRSSWKGLVSSVVNIGVMDWIYSVHITALYRRAPIKYVIIQRFMDITVVNKFVLRKEWSNLYPLVLHYSCKEVSECEEAPAITATLLT